jgi:hypothetical protein
VVEEEVHIFPDKQVFIEDTCLRCHAPMASTHAHQNIALLTDDPTGLSTDGGYPFTDAITDPHAREGISCTACHQMQDPETVGAGTAEENLLASMSGHYKINSSTENGASDPVIFGPFEDSLLKTPMENRTIYTPDYAAHINESRMCATCHNLYTPTLDLNGDPYLVGGNIAQFPEQTPYWDWLNSDYSDPATGKTCQQCHMAEPETDFTTPITTRPNNAGDRPSPSDPADSFFAEHVFVGGNAYLLGLLKEYMQELGIADKTTEAGFDAKIDQTRTMLTSAANLNIGTVSSAADTLTIPVTIENLTGHRLPTSFPSRRMWIYMKVTDNNGTVVFESGGVDAKGHLAKDTQFSAYECLKIEKDDPVFDYSQCYEPHHDIIDNDEKIAIYEPVLGDVNGDITHVLLHANEYIKDNRIPPKGWTAANRHPNPITAGMYDDDVRGLATADTNFVNNAYNTVNVSDGIDTVTYEVNIATATAPFTIETELRYQTIRPSFVYGMHADEHSDEDTYVGRFKTMYKDNPPIPEVIASDDTTYAP